MKSTKLSVFVGLGFTLLLAATFGCQASQYPSSRTVSGTEFAFQRSGSGAVTQVSCPLPEFTSGLNLPLGLTQSAHGNLLVSEAGTSTPNSGRISIIDTSGARRTLLDGLPSGLNDIGEPSGPAGLFLHGRTLYVAIGVGDTVIGGGLPGTAVPNPNPPSSPIFSSVLSIHFSSHVEINSAGFSLTTSDQQVLAEGGKLTLSNGGGDKIVIELVADFPNFVANPLPILPQNVSASNPFDLVRVADRLYVTDGGRNLVRDVNLATGAVSILAEFPPIANPAFGPPVIDAVPTGITYSEHQLLVALFRGFPFPPGTSVVEQVDPALGTHSPLISGLKTAIDIIPLRNRDTLEYLVLQHSSGSPGPLPAAGPGLLLHFETPGGAPTTVADCFTRPTAMTLDKKTGTVYVTEYAGRIVAFPLGG